MLVQEHLLLTSALLSLLNVELQHLELLAGLATEDPLPRLSLEPGQQHTKLQRLLLQQHQSHLPNRLSLNQLHLLLHQEQLLQSRLPANP